MRAEEFLVACELHDPQRLAAALDGGIDAAVPLDGMTPVTWLLGMYTRSDRLPACLRALLDRGGQLADSRLTPVLLNDPVAVAAAVAADPGWPGHRTTMPSAFTPLDGATPLHVAAEFGQLRAVEALIAAGADVNARAGTDADGLGGHTPIFHTVNSHANRSLPLLHALVAAGADVTARVDGLV